MAQVTLHNGTVAEVTRDNWQSLAQENLDASRADGIDLDPSANLAAFQQAAGVDGFFPGSAPPGYMGQAPPGGGYAFFAGLEELFTSPTAYVEDTVGIKNDYVPPSEPGGGSAFVAGLEDLVHDPADFFNKLGNPLAGVLPDTNTTTVWLVLGVVGILGIAYIAHKVL